MNWTLIKRWCRAACRKLEGDSLRYAEVKEASPKIYMTCKDKRIFKKLFLKYRFYDESIRNKFFWGVINDHCYVVNKKIRIYFNILPRLFSNTYKIRTFFLCLLVQILVIRYILSNLRGQGGGKASTIQEKNCRLPLNFSYSFI